MARQGFFDSTTVTQDPVTGLPVGDKAEGSDFLADTLYAILGNGVSMTPTSNLLVQTKTGLIVTLKAGKLWKNGYKLWETADRDITFTSSASEQTFYISGRLDVASGEFTNGEVYPYTTFDSATDVCVAKIVIPANQLTITDAMITDLRYNTTYCGQIDEYRERSLALIAELEDALALLISGGVPAHASNHHAGAADADFDLIGQRRMAGLALEEPPENRVAEAEADGQRAEIDALERLFEDLLARRVDLEAHSPTFARRVDAGEEHQPRDERDHVRKNQRGGFGRRVADLFGDSADERNGVRRGGAPKDRLARRKK